MAGWRQCFRNSCNARRFGPSGVASNRCCFPTRKGSGAAGARHRSGRPAGKIRPCRWQWPVAPRCPEWRRRSRLRLRARRATCPVPHRYTELRARWATSGRAAITPPADQRATSPESTHRWMAHKPPATQRQCARTMLVAGWRPTSGARPRAASPGRTCSPTDNPNRPSATAGPGNPQPARKRGRGLATLHPPPRAGYRPQPVRRARHPWGRRGTGFAWGITQLGRAHHVRTTVGSGCKSTAARDARRPNAWNGSGEG